MHIIIGVLIILVLLCVLASYGSAAKAAKKMDQGMAAGRNLESEIKTRFPEVIAALVSGHIHVLSKEYLRAQGEDEHGMPALDPSWIRIAHFFVKEVVLTHDSFRPILDGLAALGELDGVLQRGEIEAEVTRVVAKQVSPAQYLEDVKRRSMAQA
jgi:hypothetical protein